MKVSGNYCTGIKPAFGTNKGFLEAAEKLKKRITPESMDDLEAHSQDLEKTDEFVKKVENILDDKEMPDMVKRFMKELPDVRNLLNLD